MTRIILHVDMDSFYAAIEQRENPSLRGLPVVVGSDPMGGYGRGVVSTCSYEARVFGIHSAMPISRAYKLCPDAAFVRVNMPLYKQASSNIMQILRSYTDRFQQVSVDEAFLDISDMVVDISGAEVLARKIKSHILAQEGLTCSIGIAPNKSIAKIASDFKKPDGLTVVAPEKVMDFLAPLNVRRLSGVGRKNEEILHKMGIKTIGQLAGFDEGMLTDTFGRWGKKMKMLAQGVDGSEVQEQDVVKSVSKEDTFMEDVAEPDILYESLDTICEKVHKVLVRKGFSFKTVSVKVRLENFKTFSRAKTLDTHTRDIETIKRVSRSLAREFFDGRKLRLLGVRLTHLNKSNIIQTTLDDFHTT